MMVSLLLASKISRVNFTHAVECYFINNVSLVVIGHHSVSDVFVEACVIIEWLLVTERVRDLGRLVAVADIPVFCLLLLSSGLSSMT